MDKLFENVRKELKQIEANGLTSSNLDTAYKLASLGKNLKKIDKEGDQMRDRYMGDGHRGGDYRAYIEGEYGRPRMGRYRTYDGDRFTRHLDYIDEGLDMYMYGKDRYFDGGDKYHLHEGLEKLMYGVCMLVETAMDFAETPEEKEIVRKHVQKMKNI